MWNLSPRERQVLDQMKDFENDVVATARKLKISENQVRVHRTNARRKEAAAEKFLANLRRNYKKVLHPRRTYKF